MKKLPKASPGVGENSCPPRKGEWNLSTSLHPSLGKSRAELVNGLWAVGPRSDSPACQCEPRLVCPVSQEARVSRQVTKEVVQR